MSGVATSFTTSYDEKREGSDIVHAHSKYKAQSDKLISTRYVCRKDKSALHHVCQQHAFP